MSNKIILVQRKFAIYSQFLDTILQSEDEILEGETRKDALKRVHRELEETAAELRVTSGYIHTELKQEPLQSYILPTIRKEDERLEKDIDNAPTLEALKEFKEAAAKAGMVSTYMKKLNELTNNI